MTYKADLPIEIIQLVLTYLAPRHLVQTMLVCHTWAIISRQCLYHTIYIHSNRQYKRWLQTLEYQCLHIRCLVRTVRIHPQVHLDLRELPLLHLCPRIESFDISGTYSSNINDILGKKYLYPKLLHHWKYLKRLSGYHGDAPSTWIPVLHSQLTSLVCTINDLSSLLLLEDQHIQNDDDPTNNLICKIRQPYIFSDLVDLQLAFGFSGMTTATLDHLHALCPSLVRLTLYAHSFSYTNISSITATPTLKSLAISDLASCDSECYTYLLNKYPQLTSLHLGYVFDEHYTQLPMIDRSLGNDNHDDNSTMVDLDEGDMICDYLRKSRSFLFGLISGYQHLTKLKMDFQGANEYVTSIWPAEEIKNWMQKPSAITTVICDDIEKNKRKQHHPCHLRQLELEYQRQSTKDNQHDTLGLNDILNTWVARHQLERIGIDVYNNGKLNDNKTHQQHNDEFMKRTLLQTTLDDTLFLISPVLKQYGVLTTLSLKCYPGFDVGMNRLLDCLGHLRVLAVSYATFIKERQQQQQHRPSSRTHGLEQLILESSYVDDTTAWTDLMHHRLLHLTHLCLDNVVLNNNSGETIKSCTMERSEWKLKQLWIKHVSIGGQQYSQTQGLRWLYVKETMADRYTCYDSNMAEGIHGSSSPLWIHTGNNGQGLPGLYDDDLPSLVVKCDFVEDVLFC